ncbi:MAG: sodium-translocating pyrophosphatase [archaeon]
MFDAISIAIGTGFLVLLFAAYLIFWIMKQEQGNEKMKAIASAIQDGAKAYLMRQYKTLAIFVVLLAIVIAVFLNTNMAFAFVLGVLCSGFAGYLGMMISVRANVRTAQAAEKGLNEAVKLSIRGGTVTGMVLTGLGLIGVAALYVIFNNLGVLIGFGFGASLMSLFARVGGGIYTKAADVGADLVGKIEKGIPEDDPRNPAVIADNVGDNVGDCAGMAADLFESYVVTIIAAMLLGVTLGTEYVLLPLTFAGVTAIANAIGTFFINVKTKENAVRQLYMGVFVSVILGIIFAYFVASWNMNLFYVYIVGALTTVLISLITEYYTDGKYKPVKGIAEASKTGAGTNLISGLAVGLKSTALPAILIVIAIGVSYSLAGLYGVALAAAAMLSFTGIIIALDAYGPITDNAGGIAEMSNMSAKVREVTDLLDAAGNTTKATTKGFAITGAALSALALFAAFSAEAKLTMINLLDPAVTIGLFIGALLPFLFASYLMGAVGRAAFAIVEEVRRQFKEIKGIMEGKAKPDYARCVDISTQAALKELMIPGIIAVFSPIVVGYLFGVQAVAGLLAGSIVSGFLLALTMCTGGAAWDNAKKYIEQGAFGGKGSDAHKAAVVGDTVGDPFKDTAGPALNSLIKVLNTVALVFAPLLTAIALNLI